MHGSEREMWDYLDLALLRLAKINRSKLSSPTGDQQFYEAFFTRNDEELLGTDADRRRRFRGAILKRVVDDEVSQNAMILDVGCGTGDNLRYIHRSDLTLFGIEYAENTARIAIQNLGDKANIQIASATAIPFPDQHFDFALCIEVLEHIDDHETALGEITRILKRGGKLVMSVPYRFWFPSYFELMGHYRHYTRGDVEGMLARHGFDVVKHLENYPHWSRFANYCHVTCRVYALILRLVGGKASAVEVRAPFSDRRLHDLLLGYIEPIRQREIGVDYSKFETSTFVLAQKQ